MARASAATCPVLQHAAPSEADKALLAADYKKAEDLYRSALAANPGRIDLIAGLVHALLRDQQVQEAADTVNTALAAAPKSPALITLGGEVEFRQGQPWDTVQSVKQSLQLDSCNPRTHLLLADLFHINSMYASAQASLLTAHQLDPEDPDIREEWMMTLPLKQKIAEMEAYLSQPSGDDPEELRHLREYLEHLKKVETEPPKPCRLTSQTSSAEIPFAALMTDAGHIQAFGLDVKVNGHNSRLEIDTGAGGLLISRSLAKHAKLQSFSGIEVGGIGDEGEKSGYTAYADSIRIGDMEFQNCAVQVVGGGGLPGDVDGLIGMDVFSRFLVTLDYPGRKLMLGPLPARPGDGASHAPRLKTGDEDDASETAPPQPQQASSPGAGGSGTAPPIAHGPYDRYIAPEMQDYTKVFRVGHYLIIPAALNASKIKLFMLDTGAFTTIISPPAAREVTKVHSGSILNVQGLNGEVEKLFSADDITFRFAGLSQHALGVMAFDTSKVSKSAGMEISGFLGATTLGQLTMHIDYRDGLVKFDYDRKRVSGY